MKTIETFLVLSLLAVGPACTDRDAAPAEADRQAVSSAQAERERAEAARRQAEEKLEQAKKDLDRAEENLDVAKENVEEAREDIDLGADWSGPERDAWSRSWSVFAGGTSKKVDLGDWTIERGDAGVYTAQRKTPIHTPTPVPLPDVAVLAAVKAKLALDPDIKARNIDVDVQGAKATLKGTVESPEEAGEAIRIALGTRSIDRVESHLTWSIRRM